MAQVSNPQEPIAIASGYQPGGQNGSLTAADLEGIREYQKVISFRDAIVSGKHPRIKVVTAKPITPAQQPQATSTMPATERTARTERVASSSSFAQPQALQNPHIHAHAPNLNSHQVDNYNSFMANLQQSAVASAATGISELSVASAASTFIPGVSAPLDDNKTLRDPNDKARYLEKQREKLEQELEQQLHQRSEWRSSSEHIDLDLADVLAKALTVVQATAPISTGTPNAATISDSSDSFDDNTFYSSSFETPVSRASPRVQKVISQDVPVQGLVTPLHGPHATPMVKPQPRYVSQPPTYSPTPSYQQQISQSEQPTQTASSSRPLPPSTGIPPKPTQGPGSSLVAQFHQLHSMEPQVISSDSGPASRSDNGNTDSDQPGDYRARLAGLLPAPPLIQQQPQGLLVRAHDLSPYAPQPAHISSLATVRVPPASDPEISILPGAPAQVTALRQQHGVLTSPESSPQGEKRSKKKNNKKNKRKAEARTSDVPGSPYIKPEPRSPSPLSAPQFARPQKRLRSDPHQQPEIVYEETRIGRPVSVLRREPFTTTHAPAAQSPYGFERVDDPYARQARQSVAPASQRLERTVYEERRHDEAAVQYIQRVQSPYDYAPPYSVVESRPLRSASYSLNPQYRELSAYPRDGRMSVRPYADRARSRSPITIVERRSPIMAPPAPPPRILVDQYGREYIEPPRASTASRHSAVPGPRPSEREVIYERVPARVPSRMSRETFEEDGIIYRRASPTYPPRRVVTQPEYGVDYRSYRERDYPIQPIGGAPSPDFMPIRGAIGGRVPEDMSRGYLPRATTVRPAEAVPYYHRPDTGRPDLPPRHYAASVHPEVRRDAVPPVAREFSVRPVERDAHRREYSVHPGDRLYNRPLHIDDDVTFIEHPQAAQPEIIYTENGRRQPY
ncbi:uncharacterized protein GGS22DRAFT_152092 [Annulohypoxylon maeteangense]|uniref:uncharacterized protein n=1 Tax=Annulohypoxylon maeteangense TaxID=1927788 RepID=UPI002007D633|nr:uncharacterized protein GGS22DRAFT_152092 [Annulohypoxylon maeteangense]KAI0888654.1 hypothetical protein GGS22DRAFT_152092 [Annulohypoxylon maeteangense]